MRKRISWTLSITPKRAEKANAIARRMRMETGDEISRAEAIGAAIDELYARMFGANEEPAVVAAGKEE
jgi:hypothetical protein